MDTKPLDDNKKKKKYLSLASLGKKINFKTNSILTKHANTSETVKIKLREKLNENDKNLASSRCKIKTAIKKTKIF